MTFPACTIPLEADSSGVIRVEKTRVTLDSIVSAFHEGDSPEEIADRFSAVSLAAVYAVITYYLQNREELDAYLNDRVAAATKLREKIEARPEAKSFRERLIARAKPSGTP